MGMRYKLVQKFTGNVLDIGIDIGNSGIQHIARIILPNDKQVNDDVQCGNEISAALRKRIRKSV